MSENNNFVDDGNSELMKELIQILETGYISDSTTEHPADGECAENSQPADSDNVDIRKYLEEKLSGADRLSREQFEELAARCMCMQSDLNEMFNALVRKVDKRTQDLATLQQHYKDLAMQIDSTEQKILCHLATIQNPDNILLDQNHTSVATQVNGDGKMNYLHLTTSTADSEQMPMSKNQPVANEETPAIAEEPSLAKGLPNTFATELSYKLIAPAPQLKIHLLNDQVALTWSLPKNDLLSTYEQILSYQVYCCQDTS